MLDACPLAQVPMDQKSLVGFSNFFGAHINELPTELLMEFNATDNNKCLSVIPSEILIYKTPPFG
jgi:hypothetical protein